MHSDSSGYDGETSFKFTHKEIMFLIDVLEKIGEQMKTPEAKGRFAVLLKRFKKVQINNNKEVSVNLEGDDVVSCYHCELMKILEVGLRTCIRFWLDEDVREQSLYEEMALCCTILAKLSITSEDGDGSHWGSAAAAA
jgi:hypothetical protein|tara:strand:+ start:134 stop:547 length:414 start_codon:yes stop_codon:yes gene_type:complete